MLGGFAEDAVTKREQTGSRTPEQRPSWLVRTTLLPEVQPQYSADLDTLTSRIFSCYRTRKIWLACQDSNLQPFRNRRGS